MSEELKFDPQAAHKHFAAACFNRTWKLLEKTDRDEHEDQQMLNLAISSLWHWTQRADCTDTNLSVGYWLASRVNASLGRADEARRYGRLSLAASQGREVPPFYLGYAYEALARAESVGGDRRRSAEFLAEARRVAGTVPDEESRKLLLADLETIV